MVYKVDRLSRSLMDFARIMEMLERHNVSFVSVTQQFNTTHSMGRLTLNILLSFAQFEREIIAERTRDKIAAARRKGKWTGGMPVLGYDVDPDGGRLAGQRGRGRAGPRDLRALPGARQSLIADGQGTGRARLDDQALDDEEGPRTRRPAVQQEQPVQAADQRHSTSARSATRTRSTRASTTAIVDEEVFERVQDCCERNGRTGGTQVRNKYGALLKGLLRCEPCDCGDDAHLHDRRRQQALPLLRLPQRPEARLGHLPDDVGARRRRSSGSWSTRSRPSAGTPACWPRRWRDARQRRRTRIKAAGGGEARRWSAN